MGFFDDNFGGGSKFGGSSMAAPSSYHINWEYISVRLASLSADGTEYECNRLGEKGWEMCAYSDITQTAMFKRPKYNYND